MVEPEIGAILHQIEIWERGLGRIKAGVKTYIQLTEALPEREKEAGELAVRVGELKEKLKALNLDGPIIRDLERDGKIVIDGRTWQRV